MDTSKVNIIAAMLSRGNMGMPLPELYEVTQIKSQKNVQLDSAVIHFCQQYMESDTHYDMFVSEGEMFVEILNKQSEEESARSWPHYFELYEKA